MVCWVLEDRSWCERERRECMTRLMKVFRSDGHAERMEKNRINERVCEEECVGGCVWVHHE